LITVYAASVSLSPDALISRENWLILAAWLPNLLFASAWWSDLLEGSEMIRRCDQRQAFIAHDCEDQPFLSRLIEML
jgi:hypothetical protein